MNKLLQEEVNKAVDEMLLEICHRPCCFCVDKENCPRKAVQSHFNQMVESILKLKDLKLKEQHGKVIGRSVSQG